MTTWVRVALGVTIVGLAGDALAQAAPSDQGRATDPDQTEVIDGQRSFAFGPTAGFYHTNGLEILLGTRDIAVVGAGGYTPLLIFWQDRDNLDGHLDFVSSFQVDADLAIRIFDSGKTMLGAQPGYRFNSALGHGFGIGGYAARDFSDLVQARVTYGLVVFPDGSNQLLKRDDYDADQVDFGLVGPLLQGGLSLSLMFYP
jgi:hypothetical protein